MAITISFKLHFQDRNMIKEQGWENSQKFCPISDFSRKSKIFGENRLKISDDSLPLETKMKSFLILVYGISKSL